MRSIALIMSALLGGLAAAVLFEPRSSNVAVPHADRVVALAPRRSTPISRTPNEPARTSSSGSLSRETIKAVESRVLELLDSCIGELVPEIRRDSRVNIELVAKGGRVSLLHPPALLGAIFSSPEALECAQRAVREVAVPMSSTDGDGELSESIALDAIDE